MTSRRISPWGRVAFAAVGCVALAWVASAALVIAVSRMDRARPSQAIIVLGAAQYGGRPSPVLRARLDHAIDLWQAGLAPRLILTGGVGKGDTTSEAAVGRRYALRKGVPDAAILVEDRGRTTIESMHAVGLMMSGFGLDTAVLVSDPFHMLRLHLLARQNGMVA
ncbi:MAG TPA: YdcF family protein, partial [Gemmatimonadaceae bacterium]|nr:YdcF family protein [Gemmatimonadaceae bacterium]